MYRKALAETKRLLLGGVGITLEPAIFLALVGNFLVSGPEIRTDLLLKKICVYELRHNASDCADDDAVENETQRAANDFRLGEELLMAVPGFLAAIFAGALSDKYGRKLLILIPSIGRLLGAIFGLINYTYLETLPLQFFYLENFYYILGGSSLFYMGQYSYGSDITAENDRVVRFCRWDATELVGVIVGAALSPLVFDWGGPKASYAGWIICQAIAVVYYFFNIKDVDRPEKSAVEGEQNFFTKFFITPIKEFVAAMRKKRPGRKRLIQVLVLIYIIYFFILVNYGQLYLYMKKVFDGFDGAAYAKYTMYSYTIGIIGLLAYVPLTKRALGWHESTIACVSTACMATGLVVAALVKTAWPGFYVARLVIGFENCIFSTARSMMTRLVDSDSEVGKIFAAVAIINPLCSFAMEPASKKLYNATLETFPSAWLLFGASLTAAAFFLNLYLWTRRHVIVNRNKDEDAKGAKDVNANEMKQIE